jgi:hypothetical protein
MKVQCNRSGRQRLLLGLHKEEGRNLMDLRILWEACLQESSCKEAYRTSHKSVIWYVTGTKASGFSQWRLWNSRVLRGQYIHSYCDKKLVRSTAAKRVPMAPPTKPSTVFLGDSCINGVLPNVFPAHFLLLLCTPSLLYPAVPTCSKHRSCHTSEFSINYHTNWSIHKSLRCLEKHEITRAICAQSNMCTIDISVHNKRKQVEGCKTACMARVC